MLSPRVWTIVVCLISNSTILSAQDSEESAINFATDVRPILSDKCFKCHGPDKQHRATELRLDEQDSVHALAVKPGDPDGSELIRRIVATDPDQLMPPPDSKMSLTDSEREVLRKWVASGAKFSKHWAFETPKAVALPQIDAASSWGKSTNAVDAFVAKRLKELKLSPSNQAEPETLVRRLYMDLIGLPPSESDIQQYVDSTDPQRYEQLVDRLLADSHFGERWAIDWLDAARYADTHGYQNDRYRATWPWRDWVVDSLNKNLPYDQFITWQLAGDLLPNASREQVLATAFNRLHRQTNEGGSIEEEFRAEYVADRVNTFGAAFLGLTLECARCHDHKYDPIGQREYYQIAAFFNSIDESGLYSHFTDAVPTPALQLSNDQQEQAIKDLKSKIFEKEKQLAQFLASEPIAALTEDRQALANRITDKLKQSQIAQFSFDEITGGKTVNSIKPDSFGKTHDDPKLVDGVVGKALSLSGENSVTMSEGGSWERHQPFTFSLWLKVPKKFDRAVLLHRSRAWTDSASRGYELLIENGKLSAALIHFWPGNAVRVLSKLDVPLNTWCQVTWTYDGSSKAGGLKLWMNGQLLETEIVRDNLTQAIKGGEANELAIGQRFRDVGFKGGEVDQLRIFQACLSDLECAMLYWQDTRTDNIADQLSKSTESQLQQFADLSSPDRAKIETELFDLRAQLAKASDPIPEIMVMRELPKARPTFILRRGQYDAPLEQVDRGILASILPMSVQEGKLPSRLDLARWLTDPQHPLTSRVAVNRVWQSLFGRGLVSTMEDMGLQGAVPTHPQLLDWLSRHYIDSGWNTKALIKLIVMSNVYRQSSNLTAELVQVDPENQWLARGPAVRLSAEQLRDAALASSGLLVDRLGGAPVKPYQPEGLWEEKSGEAYQRDKDEGSRRRSLYTFWKRTSPPPSMMTFDASNREVCVVRRQSTLTPLQALVLLNDPQFVEAARALADRVLTEQYDPASRLTAVFRRLTARKPTNAELEVLTKMHQQQLEYFKSTPEAAGKFLDIGDYKASEKTNPVELAALTAVVEGLLSYDEFVMKR